MFSTTIAGSLPKPGWLAETHKLWPQWRAEGDALRQAKADATLLWLKQQEDAGVDILTDGEQSRQHFVHGFLEYVEGIDFSRKVKMGIRNNRYDAMVPVVTGPLSRRIGMCTAPGACPASHSSCSRTSRTWSPSPASLQRSCSSGTVIRSTRSTGSLSSRHDVMPPAR